MAGNRLHVNSHPTVSGGKLDTPFFDHAANFTGHEVVPIPPLYDPKETVDVIVRLASDPEDEVTVGTAGTIMALAGQIAPGMRVSVVGSQSPKALIEDSPPALDTRGNLDKPSEKKTGVSGGRLAK